MEGRRGLEKQRASTLREEKDTYAWSDLKREGGQIDRQTRERKREREEEGKIETIEETRQTDRKHWFLIKKLCRHSLGRNTSRK